MRTLSILLFVAATGCGADGNASLGGDVVGSWRVLPNATQPDPDPVAERQVLEFTDAGRYTETENGRVTMGSYTTDGGDLSFTEDGDTGAFVVPYLATAERFVMGALVGPSDGLVGTWTGEATFGSDTAIVTIELAADSTAHLSYDHSTTDDESYDGTWSAIGDDVEITYMPQENFTVHTRETRVGNVLGTAYERLP